MRTTRQLERELTAAKTRIKRLEGVVAAADKYIEALQASDDDYTVWVCNTAEACNAYWASKYEAKESKP